MARERQTNWAYGEVSPALWGRTDLAQYAAAAKTLLNFYVTPQGTVVNRAGTWQIATLSGGAARVVPFIYSETDRLLLVFENLLLSVWSVSTGLMTWSSPTEYLVADIPALDIKQVGNVVTITHESYDTQKLVRVSDSNWEMADLTFNIFGVGIGTPTPRLQVPGNHPSDPTLYSAEGNAQHPAREWTYQVTQVFRNLDDGRLYETAPETIAESVSHRLAFGVEIYEYDPVPSDLAVYPDWSQRIVFYESAFGGGYDLFTPVNGGWGAAGTIEKRRIYRGRDGIFGFIGETTGDFFVDDGALPDFSNPPPQGRNPFEVYSGDTLLRTEKPRANCIHENRRVLAYTAERPGLVLGSAIGLWENFDEVVLPDASDALETTLASAKQEDIRHLVSRDSGVLVFTGSSVYELAGSGQSAVLTPTSIAARKKLLFGAARYPAPLEADASLFFMAAKGVTPWLVIFGDALSAENVSTLSRHFFEGYSIVSWAWAPDPHRVLWAARSDGKLLSFTFAPELGTAAWTQHELAGGGLVESIAAVPDGAEDAIFLVVNRSGVRTLERLAPRVIFDLNESMFLDRAITRRASTSGVLGGVSLEFWRGTVDIGGVESGQWAIYPTSGVDVGLAGSAISVVNRSGGERLVFRLGAWSTSDFGYAAELIWPALDEDAQIELETSYQGAETDDFYRLFDTIAGLEHLNGQAVTAVVDGVVYEELTVAGGTVALPEAGDIVHVGLGYTSDLESLGAVQERGNPKAVKKVLLEMVRSRGGEIGVDLGHLVELRNRQVSDEYAPIVMRREEHEVYVPSTFDTEGRVAFRQSAPMPVELVGITRDLEHGR